MFETLGKRIERLRKERKMNQRELARESGISNSMIAFIELETRMPGPDILQKLAKTLAVPLFLLQSVDFRTVKAQLEEAAMDEPELMAVVLRLYREKRLGQVLKPYMESEEHFHPPPDPSAIASQLSP